MDTALLLIDLQNDYFPGGKNPLVGSLEAIEQAQRLLQAFRQNVLPVIHIQHLSTRPGASFFIPGTPGAEIHAGVEPLPGETVIQKQTPNSFRETPLLDYLQHLEITRLVVCGMMTHMCVDAGVRAAYDLGFEPWLASDACATKDLAFGEQKATAAQVQAAFLAALTAYGKVMNVDQILEHFQNDFLTHGTG
jgi:nicotinamidase-related amidase